MSISPNNHAFLLLGYALSLSCLSLTTPLENHIHNEMLLRMPPTLPHSLLPITREAHSATLPSHAIPENLSDALEHLRPPSMQRGALHVMITIAIAARYAALLEL